MARNPKPVRRAEKRRHRAWQAKARRFMRSAWWVAHWEEVARWELQQSVEGVPVVLSRVTSEGQGRVR